jgi:hypothetical protein
MTLPIMNMMMTSSQCKGISVIGDLTAFKTFEDVVHIGAKYQKGLGFLIAVLISVFIGQEYQWKTWQHKWVTNKNRYFIYLSKAALSSAVSVMIFLLFEIAALLCSGQIGDMLTGEYATMITCSIFIYAALGSVICLLSMLIKNSTASTLMCLGYVLFSETLVSLIIKMSSFSDIAARFTKWVIQHSIYGMSSIISGGSVSSNLIIPFLINLLVIMIISTAIGLFFFRKYEL